VLHYADGKEDTLVSNYGYHVWDVLSHRPSKGTNQPSDIPASKTTSIAWRETNTTSLSRETHVLFRTSFLNPRPNVRVESIDLVSSMSASAPFILALSYD
jgi:hypothetical protein